MNYENYRKERFSLSNSMNSLNSKKKNKKNIFGIYFRKKLGDNKSGDASTCLNLFSSNKLEFIDTTKMPLAFLGCSRTNETYLVLDRVNIRCQLTERRFD